MSEVTDIKNELEKCRRFAQHSFINEAFDNLISGFTTKDGGKELDINVSNLHDLVTVTAYKTMYKFGISSIAGYLSATPIKDADTSVLEIINEVKQVKNTHNAEYVKFGLDKDRHITSVHPVTEKDCEKVIDDIEHKFNDLINGHVTYKKFIQDLTKY